MININSTAYSPTLPLSVMLRSVWYVDANHLYNTEYISSSKNVNIALRTVEGEGEIILISGKKIKADSENIVFLSSHEIKKYYCSNNKWAFYWFEFYYEALDYLNIKGAYFMPTNPNESFMMHYAFNVLNNKTDFSACQASSIFSCILADWIDVIKSKTYSNAMSVEPALNYINNNLSKNISLSQLANLCNMSERSFRNYFKLKTGESPILYIESRRLDTSKELLKHTNLTINVISELLGFNNQFYFSKRFKLKFGITPSEFRKNAT